MRLIMSNNKKYILGIIFFIILYILLSFLLFSFINYTHELKFYLFYFFTLFLNFILIIIKDKNKSFLLFSLVLNFYCGIFYFISGNLKYFVSNSLTEKIYYILFSFFKVIISCNWSLPMLYILIAKLIASSKNN